MWNRYERLMEVYNYLALEPNAPADMKQQVARLLKRADSIWQQMLTEEGSDLLSY